MKMTQADAAAAVDSAVQGMGLRTTGVVKVGDNLVARLVLHEIGVIPSDEGTDEVALESLCKLITHTAPRWEVLFLRSTFASARRSLRTREIEWAREEFGVDL